MPIITDIEREIKRLEYLRFLASSGIHLPNFEQILELNASVGEAIATDTEQYGQFLLSGKVNYDELLAANLKGGIGNITDEEAVIPKSLPSDAYFFGPAKPHVPYRVHSYHYPRKLQEYGLTLSHDISPNDELARAISSGNVRNFVIGNMKELPGDRKTAEDLKRYIQRLMMHLTSHGIDFKAERETDGSKVYYLLKSK